ncbi:hypothetical protein D9M72_533440 [compost metagenome]
MRSVDGQEGTRRQRIHRGRRQQVARERGVACQRPIEAVGQRTGKHTDTKPPEQTARRQQNEKRPDDIELLFYAETPGVAEHPRCPRVLDRVPEVREVKRVPDPAFPGAFQVEQPQDAQHAEIGWEDTQGPARVEGSESRRRFELSGGTGVKQ